MADIKNFAARAIALVAAALALLTVASCSKGLDVTYEDTQVPPVDSVQVSEPFGYLVKNEKEKIRIIRKDDTYFDYSYNSFGLEARPDTIYRSASEGVKLLTTEKSVDGNDTLHFDLTDTYSEVLAKGILVNYSEQSKAYTLVPMMGIKVKADLKVISQNSSKFNFYELARVKFELWSDKSSIAQAKLLATDSIYVVTNFDKNKPQDQDEITWTFTEDKVYVEEFIVKDGDSTYTKYSLDRVHSVNVEEKKTLKTDELTFSSKENVSFPETSSRERKDASGKLVAKTVSETVEHEFSYGRSEKAYIKVSRERDEMYVFTEASGEEHIVSVSPNISRKDILKEIVGEQREIEVVYTSKLSCENSSITAKATQYITLVKNPDNETSVSVNWHKNGYGVTVEYKNTVDTGKDHSYTREVEEIHTLNAEDKKSISSDNFSFKSDETLTFVDTASVRWISDNNLKARVVKLKLKSKNSHGDNYVWSEYIDYAEINVDGEIYKNKFSAPKVTFVKDVIGSETTVGENIILPVQVVYSSVLGGKTITATQEIEISKAAPKQNEQKVNITSEDGGETVKVNVKISNTVDTQNDKTYTLSLSKDHSVKAEELKRIETNNFSITYNGLALQSTTPGKWVNDETGMLKAQQFVRTYVHSTSQGNHQITQSYNGNFVVTVNGVDYPISLSEPTLVSHDPRKGSAQVSGALVEMPVSLDYSSVYGKSTKNTTQEIVLYANAISFAGEKILVVSRTDAYNANMSSPEGTYDCVLSETATGYNFRYRKVGATNWTVLSLATADGKRLLAMNKALAVFKGNPWDAGCVETLADNDKSIVYYRYDYTGATDSMGFPIGRYAIDVVNSTFDGEKGDPIKGYGILKSGENIIQMKIDGNGSLFFINL